MTLLSKTFADVLTLNRASVGSYYDANGVLQVAASGQPRLTHDPVTKAAKGLLIEEQRTNLQIYGSRLAINYNPNSAIGTPLAAVAPDGTMSAFRVSSVGVAIYNFTNGAYASNVPHSQSIHVKIESGSGVLNVYFGNGNATGGVYRAFNVASDGTVTTAASDGFVVPVGGGWFRIGALYTPSGAVSANFTISLNATMTVLYWGRQIEVGAFPTSYIPSADTWTSRASTATYFDANGVMKTAASGVARSNAYAYDNAGVLKPVGLLLEGAATNLALRSSEFNSGWQLGGAGSGVAANASVAPDGTTTADTFTPGGAGPTPGPTAATDNRIWMETASASSIYTFSVWVKAVSGSVACALYVNEVGADTVRGTTSFSATTAWARVTVTSTSPITGSGCRALISATAPVYLWGAQLEAGSFATSYIPTTTAQVTRAADVSTSTAVTRLADDVGVSTNFPWHRVEEGTWEIDIDTNGKAVRTLGYGDAFLADLVSGKGKVVVKYEAGIGSLWVAGAKLYEFQKEHGFDLASLVKMAKGGGSTIEKTLYTPHAKTDDEVAALATGNLVAVDKKVGPMVPSLSLDYVAGKYSKGLVDSDFNIHTFSRASSAGRFNASGQYEWLPAGQPRFDHDPVTGEPLGILIEEQRTNLLGNSHKLHRWNPSNMQAVPANIAAPDGSLTASKVVTDAISTNHFIYIGTPSLASGTAHTLSVYLKKAEYQYGVVMLNSGAYPAQGRVHINMDTGAVAYTNGATVTVVSVGNGWWRVALTATTTAAATTFAYVSGSNSSSSYTYQGDGASGVYAWGAQLEVGSFPSSYIPSADTFTSRASTATYFDAAGVMKTAASGVARSNAYGFDSTGAVKPIGLLLEGAATNLLTRSNSFAESAWTKANGSKVIPNATTTHDGKMIASKLVSASATAIDMDVRQAVTLEAAATFSIELKKAESNFAMIVLLGRNPTAGESKTTIDLTTLAQNQITGGKALVVSKLPDGWVRVSIPRGAVTGSTQVEVRVSLVESMSNAAMVGDGVKGIYIARAQLETGSVATSYVPSTDTFTSRSSTATYLDAAGVLQTAAVDVARSNAYAYDSAGVLKPVGLLLESAATNLLLNSYFSLGTVGATPTSWISRGLVTGYKAVDESAFGGHVMRVTANGGTLAATDDVRSDLSGLTGGVPLRLSMRVKPISGQGVLFFAGSTTNLPASGGWQIFSVTLTPIGTAHGLYMGGTGQFDIDWVQVEAGSYATSYIPTTTSQVTRAADVSTSVAGVRAADVSTSSQVTRAADACSVNTLSPWHNASEGTLFVEFSHAASLVPAASSQYLFALSDGTLNNTQLVLRNDAEAIQAVSAIAGVSQSGVTGGMIANTAIHKVALSMGVGGRGLSLDGASVIAGGQTSMPVVDRLHIGNRFDGIRAANGHIRALRYYPRKLSDADLQTLTTP